MAQRQVVKKTEENADVQLYEGFDTGFEGTTPQTFKTPFLKILQAMSPELKKSDAKFIPGAEQGQFCNTATNEVFNTIEVVVLKVEHSLVIWRPERGGLVGRYPKAKEDEIVTKREGVKKWDSEGNDVIDTIELYCMDINNPSNVCIFPLSTTSLKHGKAFATRMRMLRVDGKQVKVSWAGIWRVSTVEETNEKGSWYTIGSTPEFVRLITKEEMESWVLPAKEMLKTAETDYAVVEPSHQESGEVSY